jgi:hypothetical protein
MNRVLKTREEREIGENYIRSFMTFTQQIFGSLIETGKAHHTRGKEKYIEGFQGIRMRLLQKACT